MAHQQQPEGGQAAVFGERDTRYGSDAFNKGLPMDETSRLIASNKVEGTEAYGRDGNKLGTIHNLMVDKISGHVEYAVLRSGGFLGLGERYCPIPWRMLTYDSQKKGYRIGMTEHELKNAPNFDREDEARFDDAYDERLQSHYGRS